MQGKSARRIPQPRRRHRQVPLLTVTPVRRVRMVSTRRWRGPLVSCIATAADDETTYEPPPEGVLPTGADAHRGTNLLPPDLPRD